MTKRAIRIAQSKALSPVADEPASLTRDDRHGEAFPTVSSLDLGQDKENIAKTSAMPHDSPPRVTSLAGDEGSMQQKLNELMKFCTKLQSQQTQMAEKIQNQDMEISQLKAKIKTLENAQKTTEVVQEDAPNRGGIDQGEDRGDAEKDSSRSESIGEFANVLSSMGAANVLASRGLKDIFTTASPQVPPVSLVVATASEVVPTAKVIATASATPRITRSSRRLAIRSTSPIPINIPSFGKEDKRKGKEIMIEPEKPDKAKIQEQMSLQLAKELQEEFVHEDQSIREQVARDAEIARIQAEEDRRKMIDELDKSNEMINKHMIEYEEAVEDLSLEEKTELINELIKYQKDLAQIKKYQAQQSKLNTKTEKKKLYMAILRSHAGWKAKHFKGMTFKEIEEKFKEELPKSDLEKYLFWPLKVMFEPVATDLLWQFEASIKSWKLYTSCRVHCLSMEGMIIYMLDDVEYPLPKEKLQNMLDHKCEVSEFNEDVIQMINLIRRQLKKE
ncbi:hypothetical protein Tco_0637494 [Tanacetum coccineum]